MDAGIKNYLTVDTLGKSKLELVVRVYDGAVQNLQMALDAYGQEKWQIGYDYLEKAKKFMVHLYTTLDEEKGGDIANKLAQLYAFIIEQINFVQATKELSKIEDSKTALNNIREAWVQLAEKEKNRGGNSKKNPHQDRPTKGISYSA